jgi:hypothetical protein
MSICKAIAPFAIAIAPAVAPAANLNLVCFGEGAANRVDATQGYATNSNGDRATATVYSHSSEGFADQINVELRDDGGRIRIPRTMLPLIHGGEDGWMRLTNIEETPNEITAKAYLNFMSRPNVRIDRLTGVISISGKAGRFTGQCEAYDPETVQRRF